MKLDIKLDSAILTFGKIRINLTWFYKKFRNKLSANFKSNVFFRLNQGEFPLLQNIYKDLKKIDYGNAYKNLIKNLDNDSIELVNRQLKLINNLYSYKKFFPYINFFTQKEETILKDVYKNFACKIFKTSDNIYQYKDFKFPHSIIGSNVLYYEHGISTLKNSNFKNRDIIDAGACCGDSALVLSKYTDKKVYSFEPCTQQFNLLEKTIQLNSKTNIVPVKFGLGSKKESTKIGIYDDVGSNSTVSPMTPNSYENINITTIDDYANENNLEVGLIKADIEGMELFMLKGAINTIKKFKPTLIISIYHNVNDYFYIKEYIENLNLNYKFRIYHPEIGTIFLETCLIAEVED